MNLRDILEQLAGGSVDVTQALHAIETLPERNLGFARVDVDRQRRCGFAEVIFCPGKTPEQVAGIMSALKKAGQNVFATRATPELFDHVTLTHPDASYHPAARAITIDMQPPAPPIGQVAVVCAGTADIPVAEEAALTAERMGARVARVFDVGVAGLHRLVHHLDLLKASRALIVVAGMEGALPSVVGGLLARPIIAVPTSIGYGLHLQGLAALMAMLNTCVPGISVVNVDNGFGAGVAAALINRVGESL